MGKFVLGEDMIKNLNEENIALINSISEITNTNYGRKENSILLEDIFEMLSDLKIFYEKLLEEYEKYKVNVEENYRRIPISEQV